MKLKRPIHIIQVFTNSYTYGKDEKSFSGSRKDYATWKNSVHSTSGFIENDILKLNKSAFDSTTDFAGNALLLIDNNHGPIQRSQQIDVGEISRRDFTWGIFRFRQKEQIEVELEWDYWTIGIPKRERFKLFHLVKGKPIELKINGKRDYTYSSRQQRIFIERNYVLAYLGTVEEVEFLDDWAFECVKEIPKERKLVDLLKVLY